MGGRAPPPPRAALLPPASGAACRGLEPATAAGRQLLTACWGLGAAARGAASRRGPPPPPWLQLAPQEAAESTPPASGTPPAAAPTAQRSAAPAAASSPTVGGGPRAALSASASSSSAARSRATASSSAPRSHTSAARSCPAAAGALHTLSGRASDASTASGSGGVGGPPASAPVAHSTEAPEPGRRPLPHDAAEPGRLLPAVEGRDDEAWRGRGGGVHLVLVVSACQSLAPLIHWATFLAHPACAGHVGDDAALAPRQRQRVWRTGACCCGLRPQLLQQQHDLGLELRCAEKDVVAARCGRL
jgi:hypothetical protein